MIRLLMYSGVRAGELAALRPQDVSEDHIKVDGKTGEGVVPIDPGTHEALKPLLERELPYVFVARANGGLDGAVKGEKRGEGYRSKAFEPTGDPLQKRAMYQRVRKIIRSADIDIKGRKTGSHVLRHSFARLMLAKTGDLRLVQRLLRHSSIATTEIYTHLADEVIAEKYQAEVSTWDLDT